MNATYDRDADAAYVGFSSRTSARQVQLDDSRILDYSTDGAIVGVEFLSPSHGVDLAGIPRANEVARALHRLGLEVRSATPP
jgi:uncharacterized protein YuzE